MNRRLFVVLGVLLTAAPLFSDMPVASDPVVDKGDIQWFKLTENRSDVANVLGLPTMVATFGTDFESWQYRIGPTEEEGFSHQLVFRKSTGTLISVARNYEPERNVDSLFPEQESVTYTNSEATPAFSVRARKLSGGRLLIAQGVSKPGQSTGQLFLIRRDELVFFYPWIAEQSKQN
jgi:hypothetical protein